MNMVGHARPEVQPEKPFEVDPSGDYARGDPHQSAHDADESRFYQHDPRYLAPLHPDGPENADLARPLEHGGQQGHDDAEPGDQQGQNVHGVVHHHGAVEHFFDLLPELQRGQHEHFPPALETVLDGTAHSGDVITGGDVYRKHVGHV